VREVVERRVRVIDPLGLHARAAAAVVEALGRIDGARVLAHGRSAPAASVLALMGLGVKAGDVVVIEVPHTFARELEQALVGLEAVVEALPGGGAAAGGSGGEQPG